MTNQSPSMGRTSVVRRTVAGMALAIGLTMAPAAIVVAAAPPVTDPVSLESNPFIPDDVNLSDCISSNPRPNCGSDQRSGYHQYVTLIVLFLGTLFIGWRIALGVRSRDRVQNALPGPDSDKDTGADTDKNSDADKPKV